MGKEEMCSLKNIAFLNNNENKENKEKEGVEQLRKKGRRNDEWRVLRCPFLFNIVGRSDSILYVMSCQSDMQSCHADRDCLIRKSD